MRERPFSPLPLRTMEDALPSDAWFVELFVKGFVEAVGLVRQNGFEGTGTGGESAVAFVDVIGAGNGGFDCFGGILRNLAGDRGPPAPPGGGTAVAEGSAGAYL